MPDNVVILGASPKTERYSYKAQVMLGENGYNVIPVHPAVESINGIKVTADLSDIKDEIHTVTLYVNPAMVESLADKIIALNPQRVIFNPGTESVAASKAFADKGINVLDACTLVLLRTKQF